jgi:hypothetical protein
LPPGLFLSGPLPGLLFSGLLLRLPLLPLLLPSVNGVFYRRSDEQEPEQHEPAKHTDRRHIIF